MNRFSFYTRSVSIALLLVTAAANRAEAFALPDTTQGHWDARFVYGSVNGDVTAIAVVGSDVYVGGRFTNAGGVPGTRGIARWDGARWHALADGINGSVYTLVHAHGGLYVGGDFSNAGGLDEADDLAFWNGAHWQAVGGGVNGGHVRAIQVAGGELYVGGVFDRVGDVEGTRNIARWDGQQWHALGFGKEGAVRAIAWTDSLLYVGGDGAIEDPAALQAWDGSTWHPVGEPFHGVQSTLSDEDPPYVNAIALTDTAIYVAGYFEGPESAPEADYLARWDGEHWHALGAETYRQEVKALAVTETGLYVGGASIARWDGEMLQPMGEGLRGGVSAITTAPDGKVYVGGTFRAIEHAAQVDRIGVWDGSRWHRLVEDVGLGLNGPVHVLLTDGSDVYVGGDFTNAGGVEAADFVARWDGQQWHALGTGLNASVYALAREGNDLYVGGSFVNAAGVAAADRIARWNGAQWHALGPGFAPIYFYYARTLVPFATYVRTIAVTDAGLYVGGRFEETNPDTDGKRTTLNHIAFWDGAAWHALGSGLNPHPVNNEEVSKIAFVENALFFGGQFNNLGGIPEADDLARWVDGAWHAPGFAYNPINQVFEIAYADGQLYIGGYRFTRVNLSAPDAPADDPAYPSPLDVNGNVYAIVPVGRTLFFGGSFTDTGSLADADYVARWDGEQWRPLSGGTNGTVRALAAHGSNLYLGGDFTATGNGIPSQYFAIYTDPALASSTEPEMPATGFDLRLTGPHPVTTCAEFVLSTPQAQQVTAEVFDVLGRRVAVLYEGAMIPGEPLKLTWETSNAPPGLYLVRVVGEHVAETQRVVVR